MKKKQVNKFDIIISALIQEYAKIPNFDLISKDDVANDVFSSISFRIADINSYKELICSHFIPATNKAIFNARKDFETSIYKASLRNIDVNFQETLNDTIRLAYVGLFHKLENYVNDVIRTMDLLYNELHSSDVSLLKWAKDNFNFDIKDWKQFPISRRINWICNCVKHKDGLPVKLPKPVEFIYADESKRIIISPEEFKRDCDDLITQYPFYLKIMSFIAQHKIANEMITNRSYDITLEEEFKEKETLAELKEAINKVLTAFRGD